MTAELPLCADSLSPASLRSCPGAIITKACGRQSRRASAHRTCGHGWTSYSPTCRPARACWTWAAAKAGSRRRSREAGREASGIDVAEEPLRRARAREPGLDLRCVPAEGEWPLQDVSFDAVWAGEVIEHVADTAGWLSEVRRVLRSGGALVLSTPAHELLTRLALGLSGRAFAAHFDPRSDHLRFYTRRTLVALLEDFGFERIETRAWAARSDPCHRGRCCWWRRGARPLLTCRDSRDRATVSLRCALPAFTSAPSRPECAQCTAVPPPLAVSRSACR